MCLTKLTTSSKAAFFAKKPGEKSYRGALCTPCAPDRAHGMAQGQISIEFLIVAAAFVGVLSLFLSVFQSVYATAVFGLDVLEAQRFSDEVVYSSNALSVLGNGSVLWVKANPLEEWEITVSNDLFSVEVFSSAGKSKVLTRKLFVPTADFSSRVSSFVSFRLSRENNLLVIEADS